MKISGLKLAALSLVTFVILISISEITINAKLRIAFTTMRTEARPDSISEDIIDVDSLSSDSIPADTVPNDTVPVDTMPADTVPIIPGDTIPADTVPADTVPEIVHDSIFHFGKFRPGSVNDISGDSILQMINTLPVIHLSLPDYPDYKQIVEKEKYLNALLKVDGNRLVPNLEGVSLSVKGRGNTSWAFKKKPMRLKFPKKISICGLPKSKNYVLLADYIDPTHLKNIAAFWLASKLGVKFTNHYQPVCVTMNGNFIGLFLLTNKIGINAASVDIDENKGVLMEISAEYDEKYKFRSEHYNLPVMIKDPDFDELSDADPDGLSQSERLMAWKEDFLFAERVLAGLEYNDDESENSDAHYRQDQSGGIDASDDNEQPENPQQPEIPETPESPDFPEDSTALKDFYKNRVEPFVGQVEERNDNDSIPDNVDPPIDNSKTKFEMYDLFDLESFVNYILVNDLMKNSELGWPKSLYIWKESLGKESKYNFGPVWDFDNSASGSASGGCWFHDFIYAFMYSDEFNKIYAKKAAMVNDELVPQLVEYLKSLQLRMEGPAALDAIVWPERENLGWIVREPSDNYSDKVNSLCNFLTTRAKWLKRVNPVK